MRTLMVFILAFSIPMGVFGFFGKPAYQDLYNKYNPKSDAERFMYVDFKFTSVNHVFDADKMQKKDKKKVHEQLMHKIAQAYPASGNKKAVMVLCLNNTNPTAKTGHIGGKRLTKFQLEMANKGAVSTDTMNRFVIKDLKMAKMRSACQFFDCIIFDATNRTEEHDNVLNQLTVPMAFTVCTDSKSDKFGEILADVGGKGSGLGQAEFIKIMEKAGKHLYDFKLSEKMDVGYAIVKLHLRIEELNRIIARNKDTADPRKSAARIKEAEEEKVERNAQLAMLKPLFTPYMSLKEIDMNEETKRNYKKILKGLN